MYYRESLSRHGAIIPIMLKIQSFEFQCLMRFGIYDVAPMDNANLKTQSYVGICKGYFTKSEFQQRLI